MPDFRFVNPYALLLFIPALLLLYRWQRGRWRSAPPVMRYSDTRLLGNLPAGLRVRLRRIPDVLRLLAWALLVIALARPQAGASQEIIRGQGIDMVLALDISGSMAIPDFQPTNRLQAAKSVMQDFVAGREFDRIGLVVFSEEAFYQAPPTLDYAVLQAAIEQVRLSIELGLGERTAIGMGLASSANMLRASDAPGKVIILLTDGENNTGTIDPLIAADAAQTLGIRIYTIGMGTTGSVRITDEQGNPRNLRTELDEELLRQIAQIGGGRYYNALDTLDLQNIYDEIDRLERIEVNRTVQVRWDEQGPLLLAMAFGLLLLERTLRHTIFQTIP